MTRMAFRISLSASFAILLSLASCRKTGCHEAIAHYAKSGDAIKQKAAQFLLDNMVYHHSVANPILEQYYAGIAEVNRQYRYPECIKKFDSLYSALGQPDAVANVTTSDAESIDSKALIANVEAAVDDWQNGLWAGHLSFEEFCEYLLPYRVGEEHYEPWRDTLRKEYWSSLEGILKSDDMRRQTYWAACRVNDALRKSRFRNKKMLPQIEVEWPVSALRNIRMGECYDYAKLTTYIMRACGIPVSLDFTPQWPDRAHNHHWNVLHDNTGHSIPFMGFESNPGHPCKQGRKMAKVYRYTFAYQKQSLYAQNRKAGKAIPDVLSSPFIKDVSDEYFKGHTIKVKLNAQHRGDTFAYIAVFNNRDWVPVDFARVSWRRTATFHRLGAGIVYMPVYWGREGCVPAGNPFLLQTDGRMKEMTPNEQRRISITLGRKYPLFNRIYQFRMLMKNGHFEAADNPDFLGADTCAHIKSVSLHGYDTLMVSQSSKSYRYWRYVSPEGGKGNVAELRFIADGKEVQPEQVLFAGNAPDENKPGNAFDGNALTFYESNSATNGWIGADFGREIRPSHIVFLPRNDDNDVTPGHTYQLAYYKDGKEITAGCVTATANSVTFHDIPAGTIYILHDMTAGVEERIFTYENNKIEWY